MSGDPAAGETGNGEVTHDAHPGPISPVSANSVQGRLQDDDAFQEDRFGLEAPDHFDQMHPERWVDPHPSRESSADADSRIREPVLVNELSQMVSGQPERSEANENVQYIDALPSASNDEDHANTQFRFFHNAYKWVRGHWSQCGPWRWDISALIFASALFAGDIAILAASCNGLSLSEWNATISINTVVSTISTVAIFTLMNPLGSAMGQCKWLLFSSKQKPLSHLSHLDGASRGPYGSLKLFLRGNYYGVLPTFGGILTVVTLAVSPFMQQLIEIRFRDLEQGSASLPVAYDYGSAGVGGFFAASLTMKAAAYAGFVSPLNSTFNVTSACSSGNCTWPSFQTLGVCSSCTDLTNEITPVPIEPKWFRDGGPLNFSLPIGFNMTTQKGVRGNESLPLTYMNVSTSASMYSNLYKTVDDFSLNNLSMAYADRGSLMIDVFVLRLRGVPNTGDDAAFAKECLLQYCVKTITATQRNGELVETEVDAWANNSVEARKFYKGYLQFDHTAWSPLYFLQPPGQDRVFRVGHDPQVLMTNWLDRQLTGTGYRGGPDADSFQTSDQLQGIDEAFKDGEDGLQRLMANVASAMTASLRTASNETAPGVVLISEPYIHVEWAWITLPVLLYILCIFFVVIVALKAHYGKPPTHVWKNSLPTALFHGLDPELRARHGHLTREKEIDDAAKDLHVRLVPGLDGLQLASEMPNELDRLDGVVDSGH